MNNLLVLCVLVDNAAGVLSRISGLVSRRGYNIKSLAVGETENDALSLMTIVVDCDAPALEQIVAQLQKQVCVRSVEIHDSIPDDLPSTNIYER